MATKKEAAATVAMVRKPRRALDPALALASGAIVPRGHGTMMEQVDNAVTAEARITVVVPRPFKFTLDDHRVIDIHAGTQQMPASWPDHWFMKAQGVVKYDPTTH